MAKTTQAPVEFDMLDVGDDLYVIDAMLTAVNNFSLFECSEYKTTLGGMLMIIAGRITGLKSQVDKYNEIERNNITKNK